MKTTISLLATSIGYASAGYHHPRGSIDTWAPGGADDCKFRRTNPYAVTDSNISFAFQFVALAP